MCLIVCSNIYCASTYHRMSDGSVVRTNKGYKSLKCPLSMCSHKIYKTCSKCMGAINAGAFDQRNSQLSERIPSER
jgi:hypothetical protein